MVASYQTRLDKLERIVQTLPVTPHPDQAGLSPNDLLDKLGDLYQDSQTDEARRRAIQRDLKELRKEGRVRVVNPGGKPLLYLRGEEIAESDSLAWDYTLKQIEAQLRDVVSAPQLETILRQLQGDAGGHALAEHKLRIIPDTFRLKPADIHPQVMTAVLRALADDRVLKVRYRDSQGKETTPALHPQALLQRGPRVYLFALKNEENEVRMYTLHRIGKAENTNQTARPAPGFNLDTAIYTGKTDFANGDSIRLEAQVRGYVSSLLYECPLNESQVLTTESDGSEFEDRLTVTMQSSGQLLRWLLGCGANVKVLAPADLQHKIASQVHKMAALYACSPCASAPNPSSIRVKRCTTN